MLYTVVYIPTTRRDGRLSAVGRESIRRLAVAVDAVSTKQALLLRTRGHLYCPQGDPNRGDGRRDGNRELRGGGGHGNKAAGERRQ